MKRGYMEVVGLIADNQFYPQWVDIQCVKHNGQKIIISIDNSGSNIEICQMEYNENYVFEVPTHIPSEKIITECYNYANMDSFHIAGITCNEYTEYLNMDFKDIFIKIDNQSVLTALEAVRANKDATLKGLIRELNNPLEKDLNTLREGLNDLERLKKRINNLKREIR
jgi:hypothetical protein